MGEVTDLSTQGGLSRVAPGEREPLPAVDRVFATGLSADASD